MPCPNCKKDLSMYQYTWIDHTPHEYIEDCNHCGFSVHTVEGKRTVYYNKAKSSLSFLKI